MGKQLLRPEVLSTAAGYSNVASHATSPYLPHEQGEEPSTS